MHPGFCFHPGGMTENDQRFQPWSLKLEVSLKLGVWNLEFAPTLLTLHTETSCQSPRTARAAAADKGYAPPHCPKRAVSFRRRHQCSPETANHRFSGTQFASHFQNRPLRNNPSLDSALSGRLQRALSRLRYPGFAHAEGFDL